MTDDATRETLDPEPELAAAITAAAHDDVPLTPEQVRQVRRWLADTWGERVNGDDCRYVPVWTVASTLAWEEDDDGNYQRDRYLAMSDRELLAAASAAVGRAIEQDVEMDLPSATTIDVTDDKGRIAYLVNIWGGGYIASAPDQEFSGPFATEEAAGVAFTALGFRYQYDVTAADLPAIRAALAEEDVS
jgi:hypothetical protein